ncbi:MAG: hypothetical protein JXR03_16020 [Cyclobacteriaceae bacterium]
MKLISAVFHPLIVPTYMAFLIYKVEPTLFSPIPSEHIVPFIGAIFITTFFIPGGSIVFLKLSKRITSLELVNRKERVIPFLFVGCFYGMSTYMFYYKLNLSSSIVSVMLIPTLLIIILSLISLRSKISVHSASIWGACGIICALSFHYPGFADKNILSLLFLVSGITSSSRIYLGRHTQKEMWQGATLGFFFCFIGTYFFV